MSDRIRDLIFTKRDARLRGDSTAHKNLMKECKASVRCDRQTCADRIASEGEQRLQTGQLHDAFSNFCKLHVSDIPISCPITAPDGTLISDKLWKSNTLAREHFQTLFNRPNISPSSTLHHAASETSPVDTIRVAVPTQGEVASAIAKLRSFLCSLYLRNPARTAESWWWLQC